MYNVRVTIPIPDKIVKKFHTIAPSRKRSQFITGLIQKGIKQRETLLESVCIAANEDERLEKDIEEWQPFEDRFAE